MYKVRQEINRCLPVSAVIAGETQLKWFLGHIRVCCRLIWLFVDSGKIKIATAKCWSIPEYKLIF